MLTGSVIRDLYRALPGSRFEAELKLDSTQKKLGRQNQARRFIQCLNFGWRGTPLPSLRFVRIAQLTVLIADALTIFCAVLIMGWQMIIFIKDANWQFLSLSLLLRTPGTDQIEVYSTASIDKIGETLATNITDALLQAPIIVPLLLAAGLLTVFYSWISSVEKELTKTQIQ